jgi:hypothetical protein
MLQTAAQIPLPDPRYLARVPADGNRRGAHRLSAVEQQQHLNPPPHPRRQRRPPSSHSLQLGTVFGGELQPFESRPGLHPTL